MKSINVVAPVMRITADVEQNHVVFSGCARSTQQVLTAQSFQLGPSAPQESSWVYNPPSLSTITSRQIYVRCYLDIVTDQPMILGVEDSLRAFPLNSIVNVSTVQINGESVSDNTSQKLAALLTYGVTPDDLDKSASTSAVAPDQYQQYSDWTTEGSARNPLCYFGENSAHISRGAFELQVISPTHVRAIVCEPIFVSPLSQGFHGEVEGMINVNELVVNLRHNSNVGRVWSHSTNGNPITVVSTTFYQAPELLITSCTPPIDQPLPSLQQLPYSKPNQYVREMTTIPAGGSLQMYSDTIRLSQIPKYIYLFAKHSDQSQTFATSDSFCSIENLSVQWGNSSGLMAGASKQQLYEIARKNGCSLSYPQWSKYRGSVLALELGTDIGLESYEAPGLSGAYTVQVQITFKNQSSSNFDGQFFLVTINEGVFSIAPNTARASLGNLTVDQILQARKSGLEMSHADYKAISGGSFWTSLKSFVHKLSSGLAPVLGAVNPALGQIAMGVRDLTSGSGVPMAVMSQGGKRIGGAQRMIRRR